MAKITLEQPPEAAAHCEVIGSLPAGVRVSSPAAASQSVPDEDMVVNLGDALLIAADSEAAATGRRRTGTDRTDRIARTAACFPIRDSLSPRWPDRCAAGRSSAARRCTQVLHVRLRERRFGRRRTSCWRSATGPVSSIAAIRSPSLVRSLVRHVKSAAEFSYVSVGSAWSLACLGLIPIQVPGVGTVTLGIGGGP
jgi:putative transport protein